MTLIGSSKCNKPVFKKEQPDDSFKFKHLPKPAGNYPYRLSLSDIMPVNEQDMVFHMVGDTGSVRNPAFVKVVANEMAKQYREGLNNEASPHFLYHLGDVVYNHGEAERYYDQFFEPYGQYPAPIFAIAGNHDSDVNPDNPISYKSLDAFTAVFCAAEPRRVDFAKGASRKSMIQPNIYWTLDAPLARIIGLHSNVPKYGVITNEQRSWFINELKAAKLEAPGKALVICVHHAPYSADTNHGASIYMIQFLEAAFLEAGVRPHIVFSGHVHNYQRFEKQYEDGVIVPFIVAGAGGFDELHPVATTDDDRYTIENALFDGVNLVNFCEGKHGFLKIAITKKDARLILTGEYYSIPHDLHVDSYEISLYDKFEVQIF